MKRWVRTSWNGSICASCMLSMYCGRIKIMVWKCWMFLYIDSGIKSLFLSVRVLNLKLMYNLDKFLFSYSVKHNVHIVCPAQFFRFLALCIHIYNYIIIFIELWSMVIYLFFHWGTFEPIYIYICLVENIPKMWIYCVGHFFYSCGLT